MNDNIYRISVVVFSLTILGFAEESFVIDSINLYANDERKHCVAWATGVLRLEQDGLVIAKRSEKAWEFKNDGALSYVVQMRKKDPDQEEGWAAISRLECEHNKKPVYSLLTGGEKYIIKCPVGFYEFAELADIETTIASYDFRIELCVRNKQKVERRIYSSVISGSSIGKSIRDLKTQKQENGERKRLRNKE